MDAFINGVSDVDNVTIEWHDYVIEMPGQEIIITIEEERLKTAEIHRF